MKNTNSTGGRPRRTFLKQFATGAAVLGAGMLSVPLNVQAEDNSAADISDADEWFKQVKGKHRMIFDVTQPNGTMPFSWPRVFLMTNAKTGTPESDCGVVVVLRHSAIAYAFNDAIWEKYKFGEIYKINDDTTKAPAIKNPFWQPKPGTFKTPGIGEVKIGIDELQASGVLFCVCDVAITVHCATIAEKAHQELADVKNDWIAGLLPGIQVVPSGIWAVGRAQEHGCAYTFAG